MFDKFRQLFGRKPTTKQPTEEEEDRFHNAKKAGLEAILGPMHDMVGHAIISYAVGGPVDMYYFAKGIPGTAFATMELTGADGSGPKRGKIGQYELVAFTRRKLGEIRDGKHADKAFESIELRLRSIMSSIARYSSDVILNPNDTCEVPVNDDEPNACLVFDAYHGNQPGLMIDGRKYGLMLCMEIFREELEFAREEGSSELFKKLKTAGHYPYSDLDRDSVV